MYTATGAVLAFVGGAWAVVHGNDRLALGSMFVATIVDATDGALARRARVKDVLPDVDGGRIDDIVDYLTFVFLPMLLLEASGGLFQSVALPVIAVVLLSSMYGFVAPDAKSSDHFFTGFPSYWNIVVLYLMLFRVPPFWNAAVLLALSALVFVRIGYDLPVADADAAPLSASSSQDPPGRSLSSAPLSGCGRRLPPGWRSVRSVSVYYTVLSSCFTPVAGPWFDSRPHHQGSRHRGAVHLPCRHGRHRRLVDAPELRPSTSCARRGRYRLLRRPGPLVVPHGRAAP